MEPEPTVANAPAWVRGQLEPLAVPEDAAPMAAYMKDQFPFLGVKTPARRAASKPLLSAAKAWTAHEILDVADALMAEPEREFAQVAVDLVRANVKAVTSEDLDRLRHLIQTKSWWDTVDALAVHGVGAVVKSDRQLQVVMDQWVDDDDIWVARTAILHQLLWKTDTDATRLFHYCDVRAADQEFFIRKALGWALRQYARTDPDRVRSYVEHNEERLSGLTKREALKHL
ncbi:MAG: DNA alkylation repair protein [Acidimicrobiales bacterium]|nr:DNA alkylation repair protein [Acidimicrobiales bacterium]